MNKKKLQNTTIIKNKFIPALFSIFTPFKYSKNISSFFIGLSLFLSIVTFVYVIMGKLSFSQEQLKEIADFTLNLVFVIAAVGLTIFTLPIKTTHSEHSDKEKIMFSYIGTSILIASISIFTYILSYCPFMNITFMGKFDIFSVYFCAMFIILCRSLSSIITTIVAYFNIKD